MERDALQWIKDHTQPYLEIPDVDSVSQLIARPVEVRIESLEQFQATPNRIKQNVRLDSVLSFSRYVNRFKNEDTTIYMRTSDDGGVGGFEAVLDHHGPSDPQWTSHTAVFIPKQSVEWLAWTHAHGLKMSQTVLAEFIETNLNDIVKPEPNVMLQAALAFDATESLQLASSINLDDGSTKFHFTKANVTKDVIFPHRITIKIPVYENQDAVKLDVRIRYRTTSDGDLSFKIFMVENHSRIERDLLVKMSTDIRGLLGADAIVYEGRWRGKGDYGRSR